MENGDAKPTRPHPGERHPLFNASSFRRPAGALIIG